MWSYRRQIGCHLVGFVLTRAGDRGRAASRHLSEAGCEVFATVRDRKAFDELAQIDRLHPVVLDLEQIEAARNEVSDFLRRENLQFTALVNNAGVVEVGAFEEIPADKNDMVLQVNVNGTMAMTRAFLPLVRASQGRIVNMGSILAQAPSPGFIAYSSSKMAVRGFTLGLREELTPCGVSVSLIEPGPIQTSMATKTDRSLHNNQHDAVYAGLEQFSKPFTALLFNQLAAVPESSTNDAIAHAVLARRPRVTYAPGKFMFMNLVAAALPAALSPYRFLVQAYRIRKGLAHGWNP